MIIQEQGAGNDNTFTDSSGVDPRVDDNPDDYVFRWRRMMCYKDMTFCNYDTCDNWGECHRAFTDEKKAMADAWMTNPPLCFYAEKPDCYKGDE